MSIDYSSSFLYRLTRDPTIDVRWVVDLFAPDGEHRWAMEPMEWAGKTYSPRLLGFSGVRQALGGLQAAVPVEVTFDLANHDRFFSTRPPGWFHGARMVLRQILPDVVSESVCAYTLFASGAEMVDPVTFRLLAEDLWSPYRRQVVPTLTYAPSVLQRFKRPPAAAAITGQVIPFAFGPALVPLTLLDEAGSGTGAAAWFGGAWQVTPASGTLPSTGEIYQLFENDLALVASASPVLSTITRGGNPIAWRLINQASNPRLGGQQTLPHVERMTGSAGPVDVFGAVASLSTRPYWNGPAKLGWVLLTHSLLGGMPPGLLNAAAWVDFNDRWWASPYSGFRVSWPSSTDWSVGGIVTAATPLETLIDEWGFAARAIVLAGDTLKPQTLSLSRAPVTSFHVGNIIAGSFRFVDVPISQRVAAVTVAFQRALVRTDSSGNASEDLPPTPIPLTFSVADSGGTGITVPNRWLCADPVAAEAAQWWANFEWYGVRRYFLRGGLRTSQLEPGDLCTVQHPTLQSSEDTSPILTMVQAVVRDLEGTAYELRSVDTPTLFRTTPPPGYDFRVSGQPVRTVELVAYNGGSLALWPGSSYVFTSCHHLLGQPRYVTTRFGDVSGLEAGYTSLVTANNSQFQVAVSVTASMAGNAHVIAFWSVRR